MQQQPEKTPQPNYSLPGVLNFLQTEWRRMEKERNEWEIERSDLRTRLVLAESEKKALDNLKSDLIKRVRMLEHSLRLERNKGDRGTDQLLPRSSGSIRKMASTDSELGAVNFSKGFSHSRSREILKSYLKEADSLLLATKISTGSLNKNAKNLSQDEQNVPVDAARSNYEHADELRKELSKKRSTTFDVKAAASPDTNIAESHLIDKANLPGNFDQSNSKSSTLKADKKTRIRSVSIKKPEVDSLDNISMEYSISKNLRDSADDDSEIYSVQADESSSDSTYTSSSPASPPQGNGGFQAPLRSHYDSIRSIAFHPSDSSLITGSEDRTVKFWQISKKQTDSGLVATLTGHSHAVTSVAISPLEQGICFSASADASIRVWRLPLLSKLCFSPHGHSDVVWQIQPHPAHPALLSCSADGSVKLWDVTSEKSTLKSTIWYGTGPNSSEFETPTSICWSAASDSFLASYRNSVVKVFDTITGTASLTMDSNKTWDQTSNTQINSVVVHSDHKICLTAHQDGEIRIFDLLTGKFLRSLEAHNSGVACISISADGSFLVSGGHNGDIKWWDLATFKCIEEHSGSAGQSLWACDHHKVHKDMSAFGGSDGVLRIRIKM